MQSFVRIQLPFLNKALVTDVAYKRPLAGVQSFVNNQMTSLSKALLTDSAHVWSLARVHSYVSVQGAFLVEDFFANGADKRTLLAGTHSYISGVAVALTTGWAGMELLSKLGFLAAIGKAPCVVGMWPAGAAARTSLCQNVCTILECRKFLRGTRPSIIHLHD